MFCENCGTQVVDDSAFCQECGHKVSFLEDKTQIKEENFNRKKELSSKGQRGPVPPVMRQTAPRQSTELYRETTPRHPSEPYGIETSPHKPSEPYRREVGSRYTSESCIGGATDIISFGQYVLMIFLAGIPIINIILFIKWGFLNKQKPNKSNFAKALLFYYLIAVIIYALYIRLWLSVTSGI